VDVRHEYTSGTRLSDSLNRDSGVIINAASDFRDGIRFITASEDGSATVLVSTDGEDLLLRERKGGSSYFKLDVFETLGFSTTAVGVVRAVSVVTTGSWITIGSATYIAVWDLSSKSPNLTF
jgi:hypothetical protein